MKILFVIDSLGSGGAQRKLITLANHLCISHHVSIFLYNPKSNFFRGLLSLEISVFEVERYGKVGFDFKILKILRKHIKKNDVVISFLPTANIYCSLVKMTFLKAAHIACEFSLVNKKESKFRRLLANLANYLSQHVITNSHTQANYIRTLPGMKKKISTIWSGVNEYSYMPRTLKNSEKLFFVVIGRVAYPKNGLRLLQALNIFNERNKFVPRVIWVGKDDTSSELSILMKQQMVSYLDHNPNISNKFSFAGEKEDVHSLYATADALLLPSIYEGLPTVICEAMFSGCPTIASRVSDNEKILGSNQERGFLCDPFSPIDICLAIERRIKISEKDLRKMTDNASAFARKHFLISKMVHGYEKIIKEVCGHD